jgi:hypothetical protein
MSTPIGDAVAQSAGGPNPNAAGIGSVQPGEEVPSQQVPVASPDEPLAPLPASGDENPPETVTPQPGSKDVKSLAHVQSDFIHAQMTFIHTQDLGALATAQEEYIAGLTNAIHNQGAQVQNDALSAVATAQERYILALTTALEQLGVL